MSIGACKCSCSDKKPKAGGTKSAHQSNKTLKPNPSGTNGATKTKSTKANANPNQPKPPGLAPVDTSTEAQPTQFINGVPATDVMLAGKTETATNNPNRMAENGANPGEESEIGEYGTETSTDGEEGVIQVADGLGLPEDQARLYLEERERVLNQTRSLKGDAGVMLSPATDSGRFPWIEPIAPKKVKRYGREIKRYAPTKVIRPYQ